LINGYRTLVASDVLDRDGLGIELYDPSDRLIAEVFRHDDSDVVDVQFWTDKPLSFVVAQDFFALAKHTLLG
jgi:hypothetical protein